MGDVKTSVSNFFRPSNDSKKLLVLAEEGLSDDANLSTTSWIRLVRELELFAALGPFKVLRVITLMRGGTWPFLPRRWNGSYASV